MPQTIREIINSYRTELSSNKELTKERANEILVKLSAIYGNINDEIRKSDIAYNYILMAFLKSEEKSNRAKILAECSPEYLAKREARDLKESVKELISSLKYYIRGLSEEWKESKNL
ncbi:MAG: hypothetical protein WC549_04595 [Actinomycetota bacterium]